MLKPILPLALLLACACASAPAPARAQPPVWVVRDADSQIVLFGSVHLLPPGLDWSPPVLDEALKRADDLWFELPVDGAAGEESARLALRHGMLPPGETLSAKLSRRAALRLEHQAAELGLPLPALQTMRPWLAEITLTVAHIAREGGSGVAGVEHSVAAVAPASAERRAFETAAEQIAVFAEATERDQVVSLEQTLRQLETEPQAFKRLVDAWLAGDLKALERHGLKPLRRSSPRLYRRLIVRRNARWAEQIAARLEGSGETVVVVGAGHLIGKDGLPAMLRARGIAVEGPQ